MRPNNNNTTVSVYGAVIMAHGSFDESGLNASRLCLRVGGPLVLGLHLLVGLGELSVYPLPVSLGSG